MRKPGLWLLGAVLLAGLALANSPRFVVDDEHYEQRIINAGEKLLRQGKLLSVETLRAQVHQHKGCSLKLSALAHLKLEPPDLCDRLRESTLAVGTLYKCRECGDWHFNSSAGFVVSEDGIISTCCHVVAAEDKDIKEGYLLAANAAGEVFAIQSVLAADADSDTCFLKIDARGLKPLPLRPGARTGERVFCLSHPGGYYFMFTQGMVARVNRKPNEMLDAQGRTNGLLTRPILFLNVTAEFAPGSSGAPVVDEAGNVVAQVASIADAGEFEVGNTNVPSSPSVPVRFCTAAEELMQLNKAMVHATPESRSPKAERKSKPEARATR